MVGIKIWKRGEGREMFGMEKGMKKEVVSLELDGIENIMKSRGLMMGQ